MRTLFLAIKIKIGIMSPFSKDKGQGEDFRGDVGLKT